MASATERTNPGGSGGTEQINYPVTPTAMPTSPRANPNPEGGDIGWGSLPGPVAIPGGGSPFSNLSNGKKR